MQDALIERERIDERLQRRSRRPLRETPFDLPVARIPVVADPTQAFTHMSACIDDEAAAL
jgi:hypothetical protein